MGVPVLETCLHIVHPVLAIGDRRPVIYMRYSYDHPHGQGGGTIPLGNLEESVEKIGENLATELARITLPEGAIRRLQNGDSSATVQVRAGDPIQPPISGLRLAESKYQAILDYLRTRHSEIHFQ